MRQVKTWADVPTEESDSCEFKSSQTPANELAKKIGKAASAFWNTGGGVFVAGVNDDGEPDGGIPERIGNQPILDWVDRQISRVEKGDEYETALFTQADCQAGTVDSDKRVLAISFLPSESVPHMAPDKRYYIRAGRHSDLASQFIVETLFARRRLTRPNLRHLFRLKPNHHDIIQLAIVPTNSSPALSVELTIDPVPAVWSDVPSSFPLHIQVIDRQHPFHMDVTTWPDAGKRLGENVRLRLSYCDEAGRRYTYDEPLDVLRAIANWKFGGTYEEKASRALEKLAKATQAIDKIANSLESLTKIASPTGLMISRHTIQSMRYMAGHEDEPPKLHPGVWPWQTFAELLDVEYKMASAIWSHFRTGVPASLADINGMTPELLGRVRRYFDTGEDDTTDEAPALPDDEPDGDTGPNEATSG